MTSTTQPLSTDQKGAIAESAIVHAAVSLGVGVFRAVSDGERYDLVFDTGSTLLRIQCKWAPRQGDIVLVRCYSTRRARDGLKRRAYTADEVDAIAAYCAELGTCYLVPSSRFDGALQVQLRLAPSRNNQRRLVNWAKDYELGARLSTIAGP